MQIVYMYNSYDYVLSLNQKTHITLKFSPKFIFRNIVHSIANLIWLVYDFTDYLFDYPFFITMKM